MSKTKEKILVTGAAGFIGYHLTKKLLKQGYEVVGLDNINDYYSVDLKYGRLREAGIDKNDIHEGKSVLSKKNEKYSFIKANLEDKSAVDKLFADENFDMVVNLAAQAGVRYSIENPYAYIDSNIIGFINILEASRHNNIKHLVYASSSSVYGLNEQKPFSTSSVTDHPMSLYAATKKSNELMAHSYSQLYNLPTTGLRFFTVYGPWGRPDMALFIFMKAAMQGKPIDVYNYGKMVRDFTYVDDIVDGITLVMNKVPQGNNEWDPESPDPSFSSAPYKIYNIGNNNPVNLMDFITTIEKKLNISIQKKLMPLQPGDVLETYANVSDLERDVNYKPDTSIAYGISQFISWYNKFYNH